MVLSKYEIVCILSSRAEQIRRGARAYLAPDRSSEMLGEDRRLRNDPLAMAVREMEEGRNPYVLHRALGGDVTRTTARVRDCDTRHLRAVVSNCTRLHGPSE